MCSVAPSATRQCNIGAMSSSLTGLKRPHSGDLIPEEFSLNIKRIRDFQSSLNDPFRCPICLDTFGSLIVECSYCSNVFCDSCLEECLKRKDVCPLCRKRPVPLRRNKPIERLVAALPDSCPYTENGCIENVTRGSKKDHMERCEYAPMTCRHCEISFLRREHNPRDCPKRKVLCPFAVLGCRATISMQEIHSHASEETHFEMARSELMRLASAKTFPREILSALQDLVKVSRQISETETYERFLTTLKEAKHQEVQELQKNRKIHERAHAADVE